MIINNKDLKNTNFVIMSTKSSGFSTKDELIELTIINKHNQILFNSLFNPKKELHYHIVSSCGITDSMVQKAPYFKDTYNQLKDILTDTLIISFNIDFDQRMIYQTAHNQGIKVEDVKDMFKNVCSLSDLYKNINNEDIKRLDQICLKEKIPFKSTYRTLENCQMSLEVLKVLAKKRKDLVFNYENTYVFCPITYKELYLQGKTIEEIKLLKGVTEQTVVNNLKKLAKNKEIDFVWKHKNSLSYEELWNTYKNIKKIAELKNVTDDTVKNNLLLLYSEGKIDINLKLSQPKYEKQIIDLIANNWDNKLKSLKDKLPEEVTYDTIKAVLAKYKRNLLKKDLN